MRKEFLALVSMFVLLLNDPMVAQAYMMVPTDDAGWEQSGTAWIDPFLGVNDDAVHLVYELNGGVNHNANPDGITAEELPFALGTVIILLAGIRTAPTITRSRRSRKKCSEYGSVCKMDQADRQPLQRRDVFLSDRERVKPQSKRIKRVQLCVSG